MLNTLCPANDNHPLEMHYLQVIIAQGSGGEVNDVRREHLR